MNLYISNKEKLSSIIKNIHEEVQKGIPIRDNLDEIEKNDKNKEGTEKNPITNRCVKLCKSGYSRNDKFKCVR